MALTPSTEFFFNLQQQVRKLNILQWRNLLFKAYSFKCYKCAPENKGDPYSSDQCEKDQTKVDCPSNYTCVKMHGMRDDDKEVENRGCFTKSMCDLMKKACKDDAIKKASKIKKCAVACCVSDGDTPCNSGFTGSDNIVMTVMMVFAVLKLF